MQAYQHSGRGVIDPYQMVERFALIEAARIKRGFRIGFLMLVVGGIVAYLAPGYFAYAGYGLLAWAVLGLAFTLFHVTLSPGERVLWRSHEEREALRDQLGWEEDFLGWDKPL